jgi:recombinational DNA repair protein RecT
MSDTQITPEMQAIVTVDQKRGAIESVIETQKDRLLQNACGYVRSMTPDNQEQFLYRTVTALLDEKLADCFASPEGKLSVFRIIEETMATGLELGKHAYAVPQPKKVGSNWIKTARYDIKRQGYHALLCGGDKPIFRDLRWGTVYEKDTCSIDAESGKVHHSVAIVKDRGAVVGVWVQAIIITTDNSSRKEADFYPIAYIENIRDNHSESWKAFKAKKISSSPWETDPVPMYEKTAIKAFCRPYADVKDALAHAIYDEGGERFPDAMTERPRMQVVEDIIDSALESAETLGGDQAKREETEKGQQPGKDSETPEGDELF